MARIFVCYRRGESREIVNLLPQILAPYIPEEAIFIDKLSLQPGDDFRVEAYKALNAADVVLVLISENWINSFAEKAQVSFRENEDHVRVEIETAIRNGKITIPIIVDPGNYPDPKFLPKTIATLVRKHAIRLSPDSEDSCQKLGKAISDALRKALASRLKEIAAKVGLNSAGLAFSLEAIKETYHSAGEEAVEAKDVWEGLQKLAQKRFQERWQEKLQRMGIHQSEDLGMMIYSLVLSDILERDETENPSDFWNLGSTR